MFVKDVAQVAEACGLVDRINRAVSFDSRLAQVWTVPVRWNFRLKNSAGRASIRGIDLHPGLQNATPAEFASTFLHELAHVMEGLCHGGTYGHSQHWWEAMIRLGEQPWSNRFHNIDSCKRAAAFQPGLITRSQDSAEDLGL